MSSDAKIMANRENARRSSGPRSPEGKARAGQNARRHGVMSKPAIAARRKTLLATGLVPELEQKTHVSASDPDLIRYADATARLQLIREAEIDLDAAFGAHFSSGRSGAFDPLAWPDPGDALFKRAELLARYRSEAASERRRALRLLLDKHHIDERGQA